MLCNMTGLFMDASDVFRQQTNRHYMFMEIQIVFDMIFGPSVWPQSLGILHLGPGRSKCFLGSN
jgi:hypothetical protein